MKRSESQGWGEKREVFCAGREICEDCYYTKKKTKRSNRGRLISAAKSPQNCTRPAKRSFLKVKSGEGQSCLFRLKKNAGGPKKKRKKGRSESLRSKCLPGKPEKETPAEKAAVSPPGGECAKTENTVEEFP